MDAKTMCDKELLVGYLYGEIDAASRRAIEAHLASCPACSDEVDALGATRRQLAEWAPPEHQLGFQIVSGAARPAPRRFHFSPAWGLAAAAVLVLAAAAAIANIEVRYGADGMTIRTGWGRAPIAPASQVADAANAPTVVPAELASSIATIDRRLRELETARSQPQDGVMQAAPGPRVSDQEVLRRMRALLTDSETRQNRELALRIRQLATEFDAKRRVDFLAIQQNLRGATEAEAQTHRQLWDYANGLYRVSQVSK